MLSAACLCLPGSYFRSGLQKKMTVFSACVNPQNCLKTQPEASLSSSFDRRLQSVTSRLPASKLSNATYGHVFAADTADLRSCVAQLALKGANSTTVGAEDPRCGHPCCRNCHTNLLLTFITTDTKPPDMNYMNAAPLMERLILGTLALI